MLVSLDLIDYFSVYWKIHMTNHAVNLIPVITESSDTAANTFAQGGRCNIPSVISHPISKPPHLGLWLNLPSLEIFFEPAIYFSPLNFRALTWWASTTSGTSSRSEVFTAATQWELHGSLTEKKTEFCDSCLSRRESQSSNCWQAISGLRSNTISKSETNDTWIGRPCGWSMETSSTYFPRPT